MTRRNFLAIAAAPGVSPSSPSPLIVPVHRVMDANARCSAEVLQRFWWSIWPEAFREFQRAGIQLQTTDGSGEVRRTAGDHPILIGLRRGAVNLVLTDHIPPYWDDGRALAGVTAIYEGLHFCMIALRFAHSNRVPFLSVNTCVHELLHALLQDIYIKRPKWYQSGGYEFRIDSYATRLWLFHDGSAIRKSGQVYLRSLR